MLNWPDWRRFDEMDCQAFAGAEPFENGDEPWIAEIEIDGEAALAIVDAACMSIVITHEGDGEDECWAARDGNGILGLAARTSRLELERLGFKQRGSE